MKLGLIISNDWELFGDGSGNYFEAQHKPLEQLLTIADDHEAKLTIMAEVGQQWAHKKIARQEQWAADTVEAWESILKTTILRRHDVQLHLHTQWCAAEYKHQKWEVDLSKWAISSLPTDTMAKILMEGKLYLEHLLKPVNSSYECIAFRAGAYCIEPSRSVIQNLLKAGLICDSSVTKGLYNPGFFDYRDAASSLIPWYTEESNVKYQKKEQSGLLEIPIYSHSTVDLPVLRRILWPWLYYAFFSGVHIRVEDRKWLNEQSRWELQSYPIHRRPVLNRKKFWNARVWLAKLIAKRAIQLDYDSLPASIFLKFMENIFRSQEVRSFENMDVVIPVMASGHVKRMHSCENIKRIFEGINKTMREKVIYWRLTDAIHYWSQRGHAKSL